MRLYVRHTGGPAPLRGDQEYTHHFDELAEPQARSFANLTTRYLLRIPYRQRGSWDDFGIVEREEQQEFLLTLFKSSNLDARLGYPGELLFPDEATQARAAQLLKEALGVE
ncbi:MAG: hypothetical protein KIT72_06670 [Polyangiaceae bacterium]|nr:hypothetical protein [Polyangiaceae bacterium]MCW5790086.1 hypothetical protein [Polyangiaceae bacterium]